MQICCLLLFLTLSFGGLMSINLNPNLELEGWMSKMEFNFFVHLFLCLILTLVNSQSFVQYEMLSNILISSWNQKYSLVRLVVKFL